MTRIAHADKALNINEVVRHEPPPACLTARHALRARHHAPRGRRFYSNEVYAYDGPRLLASRSFDPLFQPGEINFELFVAHRSAVSFLSYVENFVST